MKKTFLLASAFLLCTTLSHGALSPIGYWFSGEKTAKLELMPCASDPKKICGRIAALKVPIDPETGKPKLDKHNSENESLRTRSVLGLENIKDFDPKGDNRWEDGTIYDPKKGATYSGYMEMEDDNTLHLSGYIGPKLTSGIFSRTDTWTRTTKDSGF